MTTRRLSKIGGLTSPGATTSAWAPLTTYRAGTLVVNDGQLYQATADHTSGATFTTANWAQVAAGEVALAQITANATVVTDGTDQAIAGLEVTFATGLRPVRIELDLWAVRHSAVQASGGFYVGIYDVTAGALIGSKAVDLPTASRYGSTPIASARIPANTASRTYRAAIHANAAGTATIAAGASNPGRLTATVV